MIEGKRVSSEGVLSSVLGFMVKRRALIALNEATRQKVRLIQLELATNHLTLSEADKRLRLTRRRYRWKRRLIKATKFEETQ